MPTTTELDAKGQPWPAPTDFSNVKTLPEQPEKEVQNEIVEGNNLNNTNSQEDNKE